MAARFDLRAPTDADCDWLAAHMRRADRLEVDAAWGAVANEDVAAHLRRAVADAWRVSAVDHEGELLGFVGTSAISMAGGKGCLWALATDKLYRLPSVLTRVAQTHIAEVGGVFPHLINYVDARNVKSLRWLRWMGATIHDPEPFGRQGLPFHKFEIEADHVR